MFVPVNNFLKTKKNKFKSNELFNLDNASHELFIFLFRVPCVFLQKIQRLKASNFEQVMSIPNQTMRTNQIDKTRKEEIKTYWNALRARIQRKRSSNCGF